MPDVDIIEEVVEQEAVQEAVVPTENIVQEVAQAEATITLCSDDPDIVVEPQLMPSQLQAALIQHTIAANPSN